MDWLITHDYDPKVVFTKWGFNPDTFFVPVDLPSEIDPDRMININTAGTSELEQLPGIGPSLAKEIIDHRSANGLFNSANDLLAVSGIGPAKLEMIRNMITFQ